MLRAQCSEFIRNGHPLKKVQRKEIAVLKVNGSGAYADWRTCRRFRIFFAVRWLGGRASRWPGGSVVLKIEGGGRGRSTGGVYGGINIVFRAEIPTKRRRATKQKTELCEGVVSERMPQHYAEIKCAKDTK